MTIRTQEQYESDLRHLYRLSEPSEIRIADESPMTDTQYYCEKCDQVFEYRYMHQDTCEQCGTPIQDNNIAEVV